MALIKRVYVDGETIITAQNLNDIQDEVIANGNNKANKTATVSTIAYNSNSNHKLTKTINGTTSDVMTVDTTPTSGSLNPITSNAAYELKGAITNVGSFTTTSITTQVDALNAGEYVGTINGSATGLPIQTSGVIQAIVYNTNFKRIFYYPNGGADVVYVIAKNNGTWQTTWTLLPSRTDITTLQTALTPTAITNIVKEESTVTLNAYNVYKMGRSVFIYINITLSQQLATNTTILSGLPGAVATWVFLGGSPDNYILKSFMVNTSGYLRTSGTVPADHYLIVGTYISAS